MNPVYMISTTEQPKSMSHHPGNVFVIVGPLEDFMGCDGLVSSIEELLIAHNEKIGRGPKKGS